jgi:hypothetical protein
MFGIDTVFCVACRYNFQDRKVPYQRVHTIYEDPDVQSDDDMFFTDTSSRRKVIVENQEDNTDDLFDTLLRDEKGMDKREDEGGSVHNGGHK